MLWENIHLLSRSVGTATSAGAFATPGIGGAGTENIVLALAG